MPDIVRAIRLPNVNSAASRHRTPGPRYRDGLACARRCSVIIFNPTWDEAVLAAAGVGGVSAVLLHRARRRSLRRRDLGAGGEAAGRRGRFARESALVLALFALWQFAGSFSVLGPEGARDRGRWLWAVERAAHLPSEAWLQRLTLPHPLLIQAFNLYYDILHFPVLIACLIWLFVRHRDRYGEFRITLAVFTGLCLLIQLMPVGRPGCCPGSAWWTRRPCMASRFTRHRAGSRLISSRPCRPSTSAGRSWWRSR